MFSHREIRPRVYLLEFETQYLLAATFLRFQEYYESPEFADRIFSWEEFMDWYAVRHGNFTYLQDWSGFNIPSSALVPFRDGRFDPLTAKEQKLLSALAGVRGDFYVIGVSKKRRRLDLGTLQHELVHAEFYINREYREAVQALIGEYRTKALQNHLLRMGYHSRVLVDEINAYLVAGAEDLPSHLTGRLGALKRGLKRLYRQMAQE